jgi:hypothetical protein
MKLTSLKIVASILTSSKGGVVELPVKKSWLSPSPILGLFGEGARGLARGVDISKS